MYKYICIYIYKLKTIILASTVETKQNKTYILEILFD